MRPASASGKAETAEAHRKRWAFGARWLPRGEGALPSSARGLWRRAARNRLAEAARSPCLVPTVPEPTTHQAKTVGRGRKARPVLRPAERPARPFHVVEPP